MRRRIMALFTAMCLLISMVAMNISAAADTNDICTSSGHKWADAWTRDAEHHWHDCTNAGCPITDVSQKSGYAECTYVYTLMPGSMIMHMKICTVCQRASDYARCSFTVHKSDEQAHWMTCAVCGAANDNTWALHSDSNSDGACDGCSFAMHVHSYAPATCSAPAACACGAVTGDKDPSNHTGGTEVREAAPVADKTNGYAGDTWCLGCNTLIDSGEVIHAHNWLDSWTSDWSNGKHLHWHECANPGCPITDNTQKNGYAECSRVTVLAPGSTVVHMQLCSICQKSGENERCSFTVPKRDEQAHWMTCAVCGAANDNTWALHSDSNSDGACDGCSFAMHVHSYAPATCSAPAACACGAVTGSKDPSNHTTTCTCNIEVYARCGSCGSILNDALNDEIGFLLNTGSAAAIESLNAPIIKSQLEALFFGASTEPLLKKDASGNMTYIIGCDHCSLLGWITGGETDSFIDDAVIEAGKHYAVYGLMSNHFSASEEQSGKASVLMTAAFDQMNEFLNLHPDMQIIGAYDLNPYAGMLGSQAADQDQEYSQWTAANGPAFEFRHVQLDSEALTSVISLEHEAPFIILAIVSAERVHAVKTGDTLTDIAQKYGCTMEEIVSLNGGLIKDMSYIQVGWELLIPPVR